MAALLPHVAAELIGRPLLIAPEYLGVVLTALADRLDLEPLVDAAALQAEHRPTRESVFDDRLKVATVPIVGGLTHRSNLNPSSGSTGYTGLQTELRRLVAAGARGFVLDIESPGGSVAGLAETSAFVAKLAKEFPVYAVSNARMQSAGYWLAVPATKLFATDLSMTGSIGVVVAHEDRSGALSKAGIKISHIFAGSKKTDGHPYAPLPDHVRDAVQASVDDLYSRFVGHVARHRMIEPSAVRATEAGSFDAEAAKDIGLVDEVASLAEVLDRMRTTVRPMMALGALPSPLNPAAPPAGNLGATTVNTVSASEIALAASFLEATAANAPNLQPVLAILKGDKSPVEKFTALAIAAAGMPTAPQATAPTTSNAPQATASKPGEPTAEERAAFASMFKGMTSPLASGATNGNVIPFTGR